MTTRGALATLILFGSLSGPTAARAAHPGQADGVTQVPTMNITGAASDGKIMYVADRKLDVIYAIDISSGQVTGQLPSPGFRPVGLAHDGTHLWVADLQSVKAYRLDPEAGGVVDEIPLPGSYPQGLAHDGTHLWVADRGEKKLYRVATSDGAITRDLDQPVKGTTGLAWHDGWLWASGRLDDEIYQIDPEEGLVIAVMPSPGPHPWGLAPGDADHVLCADYQDGVVHHVVSRWPGGKVPDEPWVRSEEMTYDLVYTIDVYNHGQDPLTGLDIWSALPVDRANQEILEGPVHDVAPEETVETSTGQAYVHWAFDSLAPAKKQRVTSTWKVRLHQADWFVDPRKVTGKIPKQVRKVWLADAEKYLIDDPYVQKVVTAVVGDEKNPYWKARRLYEWEIEKLEYKLAGGHENAPQVLERGTGSCSEYTFSYVALCRAAGVPARYVGSLVVRKDDASTDDVFHRWAEIWLDPYGWVPVDVNHGDKDDPRGRGLGFGHLTGNLLVTTVEGPTTENKLGWSYNSASEWTYTGQAKVYEEPIAEWRPAD